MDPPGQVVWVSAWSSMRPHCSGRVTNPPWSPGNSTTGVPSWPASATALRLASCPFDVAPTAPRCASMPPGAPLAGFGGGDPGQRVVGDPRLACAVAGHRVDGGGQHAWLVRRELGAVTDPPPRCRAAQGERETVRRGTFRHSRIATGLRSPCGSGSPPNMRAEAELNSHLGDGSRAGTHLRNGSRMRCSIVSRGRECGICQTCWKVHSGTATAKNRERHQS